MISLLSLFASQTDSQRHRGAILKFKKSIEINLSDEGPLSAVLPLLHVVLVSIWGTNEYLYSDIFCLPYDHFSAQFPRPSADKIGL